MTMTMETLKSAIRLAQHYAPPPVRVIFTTTALKESTERFFPASRHRSKRIHKKMVKRFGGEFRKAPAMWRVGDVIYAHPIYRAQLENAFPLRSRLNIENMTDPFVFAGGDLMRR